MAQTPTSAFDARAPRDAGVTLVEMIIAVLIVSLASGLVLLAAPGPDRKLRGFVERFAAIVARGGEESIVTNKAVALVVDDTRFGFRIRHGEAWSDPMLNGPLGYRAWPEGVRVDVVSPRNGDVVCVFDPLGAATPAELRLTKGARAWRVRIRPSGEVDVTQIE